MQVFERYADFVVYNWINCINTVVAEVKQDEMEATESQNNEQMVGLWQIAMLGLEFKSTSVVPKILAVDNNALRMFYLNPLNLRDSSGLSELTRLLMAFVTCVKTFETDLTDYPVGSAWSPW